MEFLKGIGISEEQASSVLEKNNEEISNIQLINTLEKELGKRGVKNLDAAMKLFDSSDLKFEDGIVEGLEERLKNFVTENDYLFKKEEKPLFSAPTVNKTKTQVTREEFSKMGYAKRLKLYNDNPEIYKTLIE